MSNQNILTPVDFSINSVQAFDFAVRYARQNKTNLHLLHVIDPSFHEEEFFGNNDFLLIDRLRNAKEELKKFVYEIPHPGVEIIENLRLGKPADQILIFCLQNKINLIILSSHGWTAKYHLTTGSVTAYIIKSSTIPVICLKADSSFLKKHNTLVNTVAENWVG